MKKILTTPLTPLRRIALITALHGAWFWVPIWVLYYRQFTGYGGVALLESLSMGIHLLMIIPGGMLSDWMGRRTLLIIASILTAIGAAGAGFSPTFSFLVPSILLLSMAGGFYLASIEALLYDTLKSTGREHEYERILGKMTTVRMLSAAVASALGGWMYSIDPRFPWFMVGLLTTIAALVSFTLKEPRVGMIHDSFASFFKEAGKGMALLFRQKWRIGIPLIVMGIFFTIDSSGLWDIQAVSFGYSSNQLGMLLTAAYIFLAGGSLFLPILLRRFEERSVIIASSFLYAVLWALSGYSFGIFGAMLLISRSVVSVTFDIKSSVIWNRMIPSSVRATTLSTISILRGLPYILVSYHVGRVLDVQGIQPIIFTLAGMLFVVTGLICGVWKGENKREI